MIEWGRVNDDFGKMGNKIATLELENEKLWEELFAKDKELYKV